MDLQKLGLVETALENLLSRMEAMEVRVFGAKADAEFDESKHPRAPDGKFGSGGGNSSLTTDDWESWAVSGFDVNEALRGNLTSGSRNSVGEKMSEDDVSNLKRIGESIQAAAESGRIPGGVKVYRGLAFSTEQEMRDALSARSMELAELTSTAVSQDIASDYAAHRSETFGQPVRAVIEFSSGNGMPGVMTDPLGAGGSDEYVLPKGAKFTSVKYAGKTEAGEHLFKAYMSGAKSPKTKADAEFVEAEHPRAPDGKFGSGGGASEAAPAKTKAPPRQEGPSQVPATGRAASHVSTKVVDGKRMLSDGSPLPEHAVAAKIPPNWNNVTIDPNPKAELIASGRDAKGRPTAIYFKEFVDKQQDAKFARVQALDKVFNSIKSKNNMMMMSNDDNARLAAECTDLIMKMGLRPGSDGDTGAKVKAYGATTLRGEHVVREGDEVRLKFVGKKGVDIDLPVTDDGLKAMLLARAEKAGGDGKLFEGLDETKLSNHVKKIGGKFKTKDFRTLLGTRTAASLVGQDAPRDEKEYQAKVMEVAKVVSSKLGNTPVVALQSYINPAVFAPWRAALGGSEARSDADDVIESDDRLPDVFFGEADARPAPWDEDDSPDDDEELAENPPGLVAMLGFDPKDVDG